MYKYNEVYEESLKYFNGNDLASKVFVDKYALRDNNDNFHELTPDDMHRRLAKEFARIEKNKFLEPMSEDDIYELFKDFKYLVPQGSPMFGIGNQYSIVSLGNCFVLPNPTDSYLGIMNTDTQIVSISSKRGGVGWDISNLRPAGLSVNNAAKSTTGAVSFMHRFSNSIREACQCIASGERVLIKTGLSKIEDVNIEDQIWTHKGWKSVINKFENGQKTVYKILTKRGFSIRCSEDHEFYNEDLELIPVKDFECGQNIVTLTGSTTTKRLIKLNTDVKYEKKSSNKSSRLNTNIKYPEYLNKDLAYLLGFSYGDGFYNIDKFSEKYGLGLSCGNDYPEIKTKLINIIKSQFNFNATIKNGDGNLEVISIYSKLICKFLEVNNLTKEKSLNIKFPQKIFESQSEVQLAFISGYLDADGCTSNTIKSGINFNSINKKFLEDCQFILMSNGINSTLRDNTCQSRPNHWNNIYRLSINGGYAQRLSLELLKDSIKISKIEQISGKDFTKTPYTAKNLNIKRGNLSYPGDNFISCNVLELLKNDNIIDKNLQPLVLDEIISIENDGIEYTYDLTVEDTHMFWCEGFYTKNSGRRGASLQSISVHHPEILEFIKVKQDLTKITGSNISVQFTDEFMNALVNEQTYEQRWPIDSNNPKIQEYVNSKNIWKEFIHSAWLMAEPGCMFIDKVHKESTGVPYGYRESSSNPCGEQYLPPFASCRLLVINLYSYIKNKFTDNSEFDWGLFDKHVQILQRLGDNLVDLEIEAIDRIIYKMESDPESEEIKKPGLDLWKNVRKTALEDRRTGCGFTGLADCLAALNIQYGSQESIHFCEKMQQQFKWSAYESSVDMAKELGPFPLYDKNLDIKSEFIQRIQKDNSELYKKMIKYGRRNMVLLTVAPTGSVSCLTRTSSGLEPVFMTHYMRRKKGNPGDKDFRSDFVDNNGDHWMHFDVYHQGVLDWMDCTGEKDIAASPYFMATANEINWINRVKMQAALQRHIDNSISSTVNLPSDTTEEKVGEIYLTAWKEGLKGITVYRDGCRTGVLINKTEEKQPESRPDILECDVHKIPSKDGIYFVLVGLLNGKPYEIFGGKGVDLDSSVHKGKIIKVKRPKGYKAILEDETELSPLSAFCSTEEEALMRMASIAIRSCTPIENIVDQLTKAKGDMYTFARAVAKALKKYIKDGTKSTQKCTCGANLVYSEGCVSCLSCGASKCG